ncbi:MAG: cation:proton antiporter [Candidatus ainarchaeum sp.]|nr:cation:proton antiporter [Candidatus ainarchaeum sp.]
MVRMEVLPLTVVGVIIIIAIALSILAKKMGQNPVLGYIIAGFLLGPFWLNFLKPTDPLVVGFGELGLFILLFYLGLELSLKDFLEAGSSAIGLALIDMALSVGFGFLIMQLFGFDLLFSIIVGMMLFSTSTAVVAKFCLDRGLIQNYATKLAIAILILQDFLGIVLLVFITSLSSSQGSAIGLGIAALVFAVSTFFAVSMLSKRVEKWLKENNFGHTEVTLYALGIGLVVATLGAVMGLSTALGAYFAGFALAETDSGHRIKKDVGFLRDFFLVFFFVAFGTTLFFSTTTGMLEIPAFDNMAFLIGLCAVLALAAFIAHAISTNLFGGFFGLNRQDSTLAAILLVPLGEFVVIIATAATKIFTGREATLLAPIAFLLILVTVIAFQPMYSFRGGIEKAFGILPHPGRKKEKSELKAHDSETMKQLKRFAVNAFITLCLAWVAYLLYKELPNFGVPILFSRQFTTAVIFIFFAAYPIAQCAFALRNLAKHARI